MERITIILTSEQRQELEKFSTSGVHSVRLVNRAKVILALDTSEGRKAEKQNEIVTRIGVSRNTVNIIKRVFLACDSVSEFLQRKKRITPPVVSKITGDVEAKIIALACGPVPEGFSRWSLRMLADKCVELLLIDSIHYTTVGSLLKKHNLSLT
jgi:hypothetical protein